MLVETNPALTAVIVLIFLVAVMGLFFGRP